MSEEQKTSKTEQVSFWFLEQINKLAVEAMRTILIGFMVIGWLYFAFDLKRPSDPEKVPLVLRSKEKACVDINKKQECFFLLHEADLDEQ
jgi:hypothetical protein